MSANTAIDLSSRDMMILDAIVNDYISSPEPVGSKTLVKNHNLDISPATIRKVTSELEMLGYLNKPHTSSGRIPTDKGFRSYVDRLLHLRKLTNEQMSNIESNYNLEDLGIKEVLEETSRVLSKLSHNVGVVLSPKLSSSVFSSIEFIKLSNNSILIVFVTNTGAVYNKKVKVDGSFKPGDLRRASNYLSDVMHGLNLYQIREKISREMSKEQIRCNYLFSNALKMFENLVDSSDKPSDLYIEGTLNIFNAPAFKDITEMKKLMKAFEDKRLLMSILDNAISSEGTAAVIIGEESDTEELSNCSVITSSYSIDGNTLGTLGVIGPKSINYKRVIPLVEYMSQLVSRLFEILS